MDRDNLSATCVGIVVSVLVLAVVSALANGWALATIWNWFIPPIFGLTSLTVAQAIGVSTVFSLFVGTKSTTKSEPSDRKSFTETLVESLVVVLLTPVLIVSFAWVVLQFAF